MGFIEILLIVLIILALLGGVFGGPSVRVPGLGIGGLLVVILIIVLITKV